MGNRTLAVQTITNTLVTPYVYDALYRPLTITSPFTGVVGYRYDPVGNRTNMIYPDGKVVTNTYDAANRLSAVSDWAGQSPTYAYDFAGRLITTTLPNGVTAVNAYDAAGRLVKISNQSPFTTTLLAQYEYELDGVGNRVAVTETQMPGSGGGQASVLPQALSMALASAMPEDSPSAPKTSSGTTLPRPLPASSDPSLLLLAPLTVLVMLGRRIKQRRWYGILTVALLAITLVGIGAYYFTEANASSNAQSGSGPMSFSSVASGAITTNGSRGSVRPFVGAYYSGGSLYGGSITAFTRGPTLALTTTTTIRYTYDPLYRLTGANYSGAHAYTFAYAYDAVGNRTASTQTITSTLVTTYTYDAANRLTSVNGQPYTWDNNGNLTNDGSKTYLYNQANQLITITATGQTWSAAYNGDGARLRQIANGTPTTYTLDLAAPLVTALTERTGATTKQYLYGLGDSPLAVYTSTWTYLSGRDGLNSVRQETDAAGNVLTTRSFDPYGVPLQGGGGTPFGYTGEQTDNATSLVFLRARYMQPTLGMFLSRDPLLASSPYRYASGNPINRSDPSGYIDWPACVNEGTYRICTSEQGDNLSQMARLINNAGIGLPGNQQAIAQIVSAIYGDNPQLFYGNLNGRGDLKVGTLLKLRSKWIDAVINSGLAPRPTPPTPQPPVRPPHSGLDPNGYVEGRTVSFSAVFVVVTLSGDEMVYDFETMQRGQFHYTTHANWVGTGFCTTLVGTSISPYVGAVWGFNPPDGESNIPAIERDYRGMFVVGQIGLQTPLLIPVSAGGGIVGFSSVFPGTTTPNWDVYGADAYLDANAGTGLETLLGVEGAVLVADYTLVSKKDYAWNLDAMVQDIRSGNGSPIGAPRQAREWAARQALAWWGR